MKDTGHVNDIDFFDCLWVFHRLSINVKIEVHFLCLHWEMKVHWSRVNLMKREDTFWFALGNERTLVTCKSYEARRTLVA